MVCVGVVVYGGTGIEVSLLFPRNLYCPLLAYPLSYRIGLVCTIAVNHLINSVVWSNCLMKLSVSKTGVDVFSPPKLVIKPVLVLGHLAKRFAIEWLSCSLDFFWCHNLVIVYCFFAYF